MKSDRIAVLCCVTLIFNGFLLMGKTGSEMTHLCKGSVVNLNRAGISCARIEARIFAADSVEDHKISVAYSGVNGGWELNIPRGKTVEISVFCNGYKRASKTITLSGESSVLPALNFVLLEDISSIQWGSFDYFQLYVFPQNQKKIETLILSGETKQLENFLENINPLYKNHAFRFAGYVAFIHEKVAESKSFFSRGGSKLWYNLMGDKAFKLKEYTQALSYYLRGITIAGMGENLLFMARKFNENGDRVNEMKCYELAFRQYDTLLRSLRYKWDGEFVDRRHFCYEMLKHKFGKKNPPAEEKELKIILEKAGKYCQKVSENAIYYYCQEKKEDRIRVIKKLFKAETSLAQFFRRYKPIKFKGPYAVDRYRYDLQFVKQKNGVLEERRKILLEELDNTQFGVPVRSYTIKKPMHGPNTLVGFGWQKLFDYGIVGREIVSKEAFVIIEAMPQRLSMLNNMSGKLWISAKDGSILKIEWYYHRVQNRRQLREKGLILDMEPRLEFISEFNLKRNGIRYPTRFFIRESYEKTDRTRFVKLIAESEYEKYQFFNIDLDYKID